MKPAILALVLTAFVSHAALAESGPVLALADQQVTTTVTGFGDTSAKASADAAQKARQASGGSYGQLSSRVRKVGNGFICEMRISYKRK